MVCDACVRPITTDGVRVLLYEQDVMGLDDGTPTVGPIREVLGHAHRACAEARGWDPKEIQ